MKCPKCGYNSFEYLDNCKKCNNDLSGFKASHGIRAVILPFLRRERSAEIEDHLSLDRVAAAPVEDDPAGQAASSGTASARAETFAPLDFDLPETEVDPFDFDLGLPVPEQAPSDGGFGEFSFDDLGDGGSSGPVAAAAVNEPSSATADEEAAFGEFSFDDGGNEGDLSLTPGEAASPPPSTTAEDESSFGEFSFDDIEDGENASSSSEPASISLTGTADEPPVFGDYSFDDTPAEGSIAATCTAVASTGAEEADSPFGELSFDELQGENEEIISRSAAPAEEEGSPFGEFSFDELQPEPEQPVETSTPVAEESTFGELSFDDLGTDVEDSTENLLSEQVEKDEIPGLGEFARIEETFDSLGLSADEYESLFGAPVKRKAKAV